MAEQPTMEITPAHTAKADALNKAILQIHAQEPKNFNMAHALSGVLCGMALREGASKEIVLEIVGTIYDQTKAAMALDHNKGVPAG